MNEKELREWGQRWYPLTTNAQSLRWLYEFPLRMRELQDRLWNERQMVQKGATQ